MNELLSKLVISKVHAVYTLRLSKGQKVHKNYRKTWGLIFKRDEPAPNTENEKKYLVILPKGSTYQWICTKAETYTIVDFESDLEYHTFLSLSVEQDGFYEQSLNELEHVFLSQNPFANVECICLIYGVILHALKQQSNNASYTPSTKKNRLQPAMDYILAHFTSPIKNEALAALCNISVVYFRKLFSEVYGVPPMAYIQNLRIQRAKEMLRSDYSSIADIALTLGYNNIYEFSKAFKKHTGIAPSKYQG